MATMAFLRNAIVLAVLMLSASMLSIALAPTVTVEPMQFDLETLVPRQFGDWREEKQTTQGVVNPQARELLDRLYAQTLSRTYINNGGRRIMLSLAYGVNQSDHEAKIHRPEVCYPAQGFQLPEKWKDVVRVEAATLPVMRIVAQLGNRYEPVTYWIRIGDSLVRGAAEQSFVRIGHGLTGHVPDGILFRVSEVNPNVQESLLLQDQFIHALLSSLTPAHRKILIGSRELGMETRNNN